jgi:hypothetical protein
MTEPVPAEAEATSLDEFVRAASRLRADELVAEKPADLKAYGLDKPEAHWQLEMGGKAALDLLVGATEKTGARRYAKLAAGDLVFLLDASLSEKALSEYRSRTVWAVPPDAAQAESLTYSRDGRPLFTLRKVNNVWQAEGKPEVKIKADAVSDTLSALAGLRAARYAVDKGADLKLYGLQEHPLVVEVQTPAGRKALHVGNREGGSARYYAQVPEKDRSDVFVLSEEDARRIVRELPAFSEK